MKQVKLYECKDLHAAVTVATMVAHSIIVHYKQKTLRVYPNGKKVERINPPEDD